MKIRVKPGIVRLALVVLLSGAVFGQRGDLRVPLPRKSSETPVQQLNRDGVKELKRGHVNKAKERFVKAYLLDPDDPFTLNNLGYIAELEGDADRALNFGVGVAAALGGLPRRGRAHHSHRRGGTAPRRGRRRGRRSGAPVR